MRGLRRGGTHRSRRAARGGSIGGNRDGGGRDGGRAIDSLLDDVRREVYGCNYAKGVSGPYAPDGDGQGNHPPLKNPKPHAGTSASATVETKPRCRHCEGRAARVWPCKRNGAPVHVCERCWREMFGGPPPGEPADPAAVVAMATCRKCGSDTDWQGICPACGHNQFADEEEDDEEAVRGPAGVGGGRGNGGNGVADSDH